MERIWLAPGLNANWCQTGRAAAWPDEGLCGPASKDSAAPAHAPRKCIHKGSTRIILSEVDDGQDSKKKVTLFSCVIDKKSITP